MSIKSDKWIRRMAQEHGMIEPFVERQIRGESDDRVISYGVSSYGYDVRCANPLVGARLADDGDLEGGPRRKGSIKSQA